MSQHAKSGDLNAQQMRFVAEYVQDLHATKAAIRAGYSREPLGSRATAC